MSILKSMEEFNNIITNRIMNASLFSEEIEASTARLAEISLSIKQSLVEFLRENVAVVTFDKVDGERRIMTCTLKEELLPELPSTNSVRVQSDEVVVVFDLEKNDWRSFRVDSFISIEEATDAAEVG